MRIRLVTWNCNMALSQKFERLLALEPDIAVVQECADPARDAARGRPLPCAGFEWVGSNPNKGLGIFTFGDLRVQRHASYTDEFALYLPVQVSGPVRLNVLGVWVANKFAAHATNEPAPAIAYYQPFLTAAPAVVAGDFNRLPQRMSYRRRDGEPSVVEWLGRAGLWDADDMATALWGARPLHRTLYHQRHPRQGFVVDYIFVPRPDDGRLPRLAHFEVCGPHDWITWSDHVPLFVDLEW